MLCYCHRDMQQYGSFSQMLAGDWHLIGVLYSHLFAITFDYVSPSFLWSPLFFVHMWKQCHSSLTCIVFSSSQAISNKLSRLIYYFLLSKFLLNWPTFMGLLRIRPGSAKSFSDGKHWDFEVHFYRTDVPSDA